jgi:hypothetical protein
MVNLKTRWGSIALTILFSVAAFLACGTAFAQTPVNGFVIINPISVCDSGTGLCAPFGVSCTSASGTQVCTQFATPSTATTNTPIGFVDADTNVNLTRAFWAQAGIDVVFFPVQSYTSPTNAIPSSWLNIKDAASTTGATLTSYSTNYQTLHLVNVLCADGFIALTSPDFQALTQHPICTEHGGLAPGAYSKLVNPPPAPSPAPPLAINGCKQNSCSTNSNAIDVFFVNSYAGPGVSVPQYGFSWINGDGVSIGKLAFSTAGPRFDTLAHEIGHALALDHVSYGAATDPFNAPVGNMMLLGSTRDTSAKSGCQMTTSSPGTPPVSNGGALADLDYTTSSFNPCLTINYNMLADHLVIGTCPSPLSTTTCNNQEGAVALSPFINQTATNKATTNNGGGSQTPIAGAATTSATPSSGTGTPAPLSITITADGNPNDTNVPDLASTIIALPPSDPLSFNGNSPIIQTGGTLAAKAPPGSSCDATHLKNCAVQVTSVTKLTNQQVTGNPGCDSGTGQPPSSQCVRITYSVAPSQFGPDNPACQVPGGCVTPAGLPNIFVTLAVSFNKDATVIVSNNLLTGAQYTSIDANGYATTSLFGPVFNNSGIQVGFTADSAIPDLTTTNVLLPNLASKFQNAAAVKFSSPPFNNRKLAQCTQPFTTVFVKVKGQLVPETVCPDGNLPDGPD